jgi:hypothetical protein
MARRQSRSVWTHNTTDNHQLATASRAAFRLLLLLRTLPPATGCYAPSLLHHELPFLRIPRFARRPSACTGGTWKLRGECVWKHLGSPGTTVHPAPTPPTTLIWKGSVSSSGNNQRSSSIEEFLSSHRHRGPQNADTRWTTPFLPKPNGRPKQDLLGEAGRIVCKQRGCTPVPKAGQWPTLPNVWGMGQ